MSAGIGRLRPSPAMLVAVVALVFALTGAAIALPGKGSVDKNDLAKNAVKTKTIKNGAVSGPKLKAGAVTSDKLADGAVTNGKIANGAVNAAKLAPGTLEPVAYATVNQDGSVDESTSKGVTDANVVEDSGVYGFRGLAFTPKLVTMNYLFDTQSITGDLGDGNGRIFYGDCSAVTGADQLCVAPDDIPDHIQVIFFG